MSLHFPPLLDGELDKALIPRNEMRLRSMVAVKAKRYPLTALEGFIAGPEEGGVLGMVEDEIAHDDQVVRPGVGCRVKGRKFFAPDVAVDFHSGFRWGVCVSRYVFRQICDQVEVRIICNHPAFSSFEHLGNQRVNILTLPPLPVVQTRFQVVQLLRLARAPFCL